MFVRNVNIHPILEYETKVVKTCDKFIAQRFKK